jgi:hypothetical protein
MTERGSRGWGSARYAAPAGFHRGALWLALAAPLIGLLALKLA